MSLAPAVRISTIGSTGIVTLPWPATLVVQGGSSVIMRWEELERTDYERLLSWAAERVEQSITRSGTLVLLAYGGQPVCVDADWLEPYRAMVRARQFAGMMVILQEVQERARLGLEVLFYRGAHLYRPGDTTATVLYCGGLT